LLIGTGVGLVVGTALRADCARTGGELAGLCVLWYLIVVPSGALVGGVTGALIRTPIWEPVPLPQARASGPSAFRLGMSLPAPW
jgi:hypothetical protein